MCINCIKFWSCIKLGVWTPGYPLVCIGSLCTLVGISLDPVPSPLYRVGPTQRKPLDDSATLASNLRCNLYARQHSIYAIARIRHANSVRLSVRLSHACFLSKRLNASKFSLSDRPIILGFRHQGSLRKSDDFTPNGGAKYNIRLYLGKGNR